jgi:hypothetical protein
VGLTRFLRYDVRHDAGDVVRCAAVHRERDQVPGRLIRIADGEQDPRDGIGGHHRVQAIGAEQVAITGPGLAQLKVRSGILLAGKRPQQQHPLRMRRDLLGRDLAVFHWGWP